MASSVTQISSAPLNSPTSPSCRPPPSIVAESRWRADHKVWPQLIISCTVRPGPREMEKETEEKWENWKKPEQICTAWHRIRSCLQTSQLSLTHTHTKKEYNRVLSIHAGRFQQTYQSVNLRSTIHKSYLCFTTQITFNKTTTDNQGSNNKHQVFERSFLVLIPNHCLDHIFILKHTRTPHSVISANSYAAPQSCCDVYLMPQHGLLVFSLLWLTALLSVLSHVSSLVSQGESWDKQQQLEPAALCGRHLGAFLCQTCHLGSIQPRKSNGKTVFRMEAESWKKLCSDVNVYTIVMQFRKYNFAQATCQSVPGHWTHSTLSLTKRIILEINWTSMLQ